MDTPATLGNLWAVIGIFAGAIVALAGWCWVNLKSKASANSNERAWLAINAQTAALAEFKVWVASQYVTEAKLGQFKGDLERHMDRQFQTQNEAIAELRDLVRELTRELRDVRMARASPAE